MMKNIIKSVLSTVGIVVLVTSVGCGKSESNIQTCSVSGCENTIYKDGLCPDHYVAVKTDDNNKKEYDKTDETENTDKINFETETKGVSVEIEIQESNQNDLELGLRNIKINDEEMELTEQQKAVISYFDNDYLGFPDYEFLRRYPNIFQDAQITAYGKVLKVISMDSNSYELLIFSGITSYDDEWLGQEYVDEHKGEYIIVRGDNSSRTDWFMEEDDIVVYGRYSSVETIEVDGVSYTLPVIESYNAYYKDGDKAVVSVDKFDYDYIKKVATAIFGNDIEIRKPLVGEDVDESVEMMYSYFNMDIPYLLVELEDQSNAKFTKFLFGTNQGIILDNKEMLTTDEQDIERKIEFSADFSHFYLFAYNKTLETLTLSYYDNMYNKIWSRDFEETTDAVYDYTTKNIYIVVNNNLYIIDINTGEDAFAPQYVGAKKDIRKFSDSVILVGESKTDAVIKTSVDGSIKWQANLSIDVREVDSIQLINGNIVIQYEDEVWNQKYALIDNETGEVLLETK